MLANVEDDNDVTRGTFGGLSSTISRTELNRIISKSNNEKPLLALAPGFNKTVSNLPRSAE